MNLTKTKRTTVKRAPKRASYDKELLSDIVKQCLVGHIAFDTPTGTHSIPMPFWVEGDYIYCHCSVLSRLVTLAKEQTQVCVSFTIIDAYVLAKSVFHHSVNYRSAVVYGCFEIVEGDEHKLTTMENFVEHIAKGRWQQARQPNRKELNATAIMRIKLEEAVVKVRTGPPEDIKSDLNRDVWAGIIPLEHRFTEPEEYIQK